MPLQQWIFGYGSLINARGINDRGMAHKYKPGDLHIARLTGYKRAWECSHQGVLYLGISPCPGSVINGVIFRISQEDVKPFLQSEASDCANGSYIIAEVTDKVDVLSDFEGVIRTCVTRAPTQRGVIATYYQKLVEDALQERGKAFRDEFFKTTDWSAFKHQDIINAWQLELLGPE